MLTSRKWGIGVGMSPVSEVAEPDVTDVRLQQSELIASCHLERGMRGALKILRPYVALFFLGTGLARGSGTAGTTECFRELKKYDFVEQA